MIWGAISCSIHRDAQGVPQHFVMVMADVTRRKETEQKLSEANFRLQMAAEIGRLGFWERDAMTNEVYFSPEWQEQVGYREGEFPSTLQEWSSRLHPDDRDRVMNNIQHFIERPQGEFQVEYRFRHRDGSYRWFLSRMIAMDDPTGKTRKIIGIRVDITDRKEVEQSIRQEGQHDTLTGLPNRKLLYEYAGHILASAKRSGTHGAVVFIDLDHFKEINDTYGHEAGDEVLKEVARRLVASVRKGDIAGRLGGDEFLVILPLVADASSAALIAEHMLARLNISHRFGEFDLEISPSIGVALFPDNSDDLDALVGKADHAMYVAKEQGRGRVQVFTPELARRADDALVLENRLKAALQNNEFALHFQPIASTETVQVIGAEALLRWHSHADKIAQPGEFIPAAESASLIGELGEWVLRSACTQQMQWMRGGMPSMRIAVNISPVQFRQKGLTIALEQLIRKCGIDPALIQIEVAERTVMQGLDNAVSTLQSLHDLGVRIAIDNFGTGDCGLGALSRLPVDSLKIDTSFVCSLKQDPRNEAVAQAAIALGHSLDLEVVAEGVETESALDCMRQLQCDMVQGFYVGKPMRAQEFQQWYWGRGR